MSATEQKCPARSTVGMTPEQRLRSRARAAVLHAKRQGRLVPPERCESCNRAMKLQAHHDDYERPLEVRWLCRDCHWSVHRSRQRNFKGDDCPMFAAVKAAFGLADDLDVEGLFDRWAEPHTDTVENWKRRGIPPWTLKKLIALAEQRGLKVPEDIYDAAQRRTKRAVSGYERSAA